MRYDKLAVFLFCLLSGSVLWSLSHWPTLLASQLTAFCSPPAAVAAQWSTKEWKVFGLVKRPNGDFSLAKNHSVRDYKFDECSEVAVLELFDEKTRSLNEVLEYGHVVDCERGWTYEPRAEVSLQAEFNLVCDREWLLPFGHLLIGTSTIMSVLAYLVAWRRFDLRWTLSPVVRCGTVLGALTFEILALAPFEASFWLFLTFRAISTMVIVAFACSSVMAIWTYQKDELVGNSLTCGAFAIGGWVVAGLDWTLLAFSVADWRLLGFMSICIPLLLLAIVSAFVKEPSDGSMSKSTPATANFQLQTVFSSELSASTWSVDSLELRRPIYGCCEEELSYLDDSDQISLRGLISYSFVLFTSTLFYYVLHFKRTEQACFVRVVGQNWCFSQRAIVELVFTLFYLLGRFVVDAQRTQFAVTVATGISALLMTILTVGHSMSKDKFDDDLFEFLLSTAGLMVACSVTFSVWTKVIQALSVKFFLLSVLVSRSAWTVSLMFEFFLLDTVHKRALVYCSFCWTLSVFMIFQTRKMFRE